MIKTIKLITLTILFQSCIDQDTTVSLTRNRLWYDEPATNWNHALPIGNGRMGAMIFGDPVHERIQLNEDSMWPGGPDWGNSKGNVEDLKELRRLVLEGKLHAADETIIERFSRKDVVRSHQTMGDLYLDFEDGATTEYIRQLSLDSALITIKYSKSGSRVVQRMFSSAPDNVMVLTIESDAGNGIDFKIRLDRPLDEGNKTVTVANTADDEISMKGVVTQYGGKIDSEPTPLDYGVNFETRLKIKNSGGSIVRDKGALVLKGVKRAEIYLVSATSFYEKDFQAKNTATLEKLQEKTYDQLLADHVSEHKQLFDRVTLNLGFEKLDSLTTDARLERIKGGSHDPALVANMFQYGRYLLIGSSRPGTNPANLQGIWNEHIKAPWNADYHLNINLQMNYWPAEVTNLSECHEPLFDFIDQLIERGKVTAKEQYDMRGAVVHHATDLWAPTWMRARQPYWGSWIHGGGWLMQHLWEHYRFTRDEEFLRYKAYPAMKSIAEFYLDWLIRHPDDGQWVEAPATSPENSYIASDGKSAAVSLGSAMGQQIVAEVFDNILVASRVLKIDDDFVREVKQKRSNLRSGMKIGDDGRILEWDKPYDEPEKGHRHMSHLYALHPGSAITPNTTPDLFEAARNTLDYRLDHGGAGTGWSRAWLINFSARLLDGQMAHDHIKFFFQKSTEINLFDMHPPFQIDGNFGFTAGIAEMLLQSHTDAIEILPALPKAWSHGKITGLKARGGFEVDVEWKDSKLISVKIVSLSGNKCTVRYGSEKIDLNLKRGETIWVNGSLEMLKSNRY